MKFRLLFIFAIINIVIALLVMEFLPARTMKYAKPVSYEESKEFFDSERAGRIATGAKVYANQGCYVCHSQVVKPSYAGVDVWRDNWGGLKNDADRGDTRRESIFQDYHGEKLAQIGLTRIGSDLSNFGRRWQAGISLFKTEGLGLEESLFAYLYNPLSFRGRSNWLICPPNKSLFKRLPQVGGKEKLVPTQEAKALVSYLLSLKRDSKLPKSLTNPAEKP